MNLKELFKKRQELMEVYCVVPVGTDEWERCRYELCIIEAYIVCEMDQGDPEDIKIFDETENIDELMEDVFGTPLKFGKAS